MPQSLKLAILAITSLVEVNICKKLLFVFGHFRHGARGPTKNITKDYLDIFEEKWEGIGEISPVGLRMLYLLGIRNKVRYSYFVNPIFNINEILIYSTNSNRTIASVNAYMHGMYSDSNGITLDERQVQFAYPQSINITNLQPEAKKLSNYALPNQMTLFPIHIFNPYERTFLVNDNKVCPGIAKFKRRNVASKEMTNLLQDLYTRFNSTYGKMLFDYFKHTNPKHYYDRMKLYSISDTFICDKTDAREMHRFKDTQIDLDAFYQESQYIAYIDTYRLEFNSKNNFLSIMAMSPTFESLLSWMEKRIELDKKGESTVILASAPKMVIYSGHDTTMATMHYFMEEVFQIKINAHTYASNQYFELIENDNTYTVEYYSNDNKMLEIPFEEFKTRVQVVLWTKKEIDDFCDESGRDVFMTLTIVFGCLTVILSIILGMMVYLKKRNELVLPEQ